MKRIVILFGVLAMALGTQAQNYQHSNYIGLNFGCGGSSLLYTPKIGSWAPGLGFIGELEYMHFFGKHFGFGLGVQYDMTKSQITLDENITGAIATHPDNNLNFRPTAQFNNWVEVQTANFINIPVELFYRTALSERWTFLIGAGAELNILMNGRYKVDDATFTMAGYFPATNVTYTDLPSHGFFSTNKSYDEELTMIKKMSVSLVGDLGFNYAMSNHWGLYLGAYAGFAITNMHENGYMANPTFAVDATNNVVYNGVFNSGRLTNTLPKGVDIGRIMLVNLGAKIGINFGWDCHKAEPEAKPDLTSYDDEAAKAKAAEEEAARLKAAEEEAAKAKAAEEAAKAKAAEEAAKAKAAEEAAKAKAAEEAARKAAEDAAKNKPVDVEKVPVDRASLQTYLNQINGTVNFDFNKTNPKFDAKTDLAIKALCKAMSENKDIKINITGHTDNVGTPESNMPLGMRRAEALKALMVKQGAPAENISTDSKGETEPMVENDTEEHRYMNRRAVITLK